MTRLGEEDIRTLVAWVDAGAPQRDSAGLPSTPQSSQGWLHPRGIPPDMVIELPEVHVPAEGAVPYVTNMAQGAVHGG